MSNIIDLNAPSNGEQTFMMCPCTPEGSPIIPVVIHDPKGPIITGLVCIECEESVGVVNGIIQIEEAGE